MYWEKTFDCGGGFTAIILDNACIHRTLKD